MTIAWNGNQVRGKLKRWISKHTVTYGCQMWTLKSNIWGYCPMISWTLCSCLMTPMNLMPISHESINAFFSWTHEHYAQTWWPLTLYRSFMAPWHMPMFHEPMNFMPISHDLVHYKRISWSYDLSAASYDPMNGKPISHYKMSLMCISHFIPMMPHDFNTSWTLYLGFMPMNFLYAFCTWSSTL